MLVGTENKQSASDGDCGTTAFLSEEQRDLPEDVDCIDGSDDRPSLVSFHEPLTTAIHCIPLRSPEESTELFYSRQDFATFQANEQRRYDKMMMKRIQEMVQEAMKDDLEAAYARNATPEEIDAMMPQTTEEIFSLLGGISALDMPKPPSAVKAEPRYQSTSDFTDGAGEAESSNPDHAEEHQETKEYEKTIRSVTEAPENQLGDFSDDALYDYMSVERDENALQTADEITDTNSLSPNAKEKKPCEASVEDEDCKRQKRERLRRTDQWAEATDDELYDMFGLVGGDATCTKELDETFKVSGKEKKHIDSGSAGHKQERPRRPDRWADAADDELLDLFGLTETRSENVTSETSSEEDLTDAVHQKFHLGNDDPSELSMLEEIEKNESINDILGTSFSSEVHVEDLVPLSPKN
jgi:hypothetical protein